MSICSHSALLGPLAPPQVHSFLGTSTFPFACSNAVAIVRVRSLNFYLIPLDSSNRYFLMAAAEFHFHLIYFESNF